jgi:hypothetical protein
MARKVVLAGIKFTLAQVSLFSRCSGVQVTKFVDIFLGPRTLDRVFVFIIRSQPRMLLSHRRISTGAEHRIQVAGAISLGIAFVGLPLAYGITNSVMATQDNIKCSESELKHEELKARIYAKQIAKLNQIREEQGLPVVPSAVQADVTSTAVR